MYYAAQATDYSGNYAHILATSLVVVHPEHILIKTCTDNSRWQTERYCKQHPLGEEVSCGASAVLGKCASITAGRSRRNWVPGSFCESTQI